MTRLRRTDPRTVVGTLVLVVLTTYLLADSTTGVGPVRVFWSAIPLVDVAIGVVALGAARKPGIAAAERRLWRTVVAQCVVMVIGDGTQAVLVWTAAATPSGTPGPVTDLCNLIGMIPVLFVLLRYPVPADSRSVRLRYLLDAASVAVGAGVLMYFLMSYTLPVLDTAASRAFGAGVLAMSSFAATKLTLSGAVPMRPRAALPIVAGSLLQGYAYGLLGSGPQVHLALAGMMAAAGLMWTGVRLHQLDTTPRRDAAPVRRRYSLLPYVTLFVMFGLVPAVAAGDGRDLDFWVVIGALFAITCLVVVRQVLALLENATLLTRLDQSLLEARGLHEQLRHQATHDALTGLANRALFDERLDASTGAAAVLLVDLDGFKEINDTYGHHAGDAVLVAVADRLRRCVPASATAARLGGDEFAVLLPGADAAAARGLADRFTALLADPVHVDGRPLHARASVGVAAGGTGPDGTGSGGTVSGGALLRDADGAMYAVKRGDGVAARRGVALASA
jgi:diguanylate cyclase (GGDEF)-like protein